MGSANSFVSKQKRGRDFTSLRFPSDLGTIGITFDFVKYSTGALEAEASGGFSPKGNTSSTIAFPLPQTITDNQGVIINKTDLGLMGASVIDAYSMAENSGGATEFLNQMKEQYVKALDQTKTIGKQSSNNDFSYMNLDNFGKAAAFSGRTMLDAMIPGVGAAIEGGTGTAINAHQSLNFDGVTMKRFEFQWQFAPKSAGESNSLKAIERKIKSSILPEYEELGLDISSTATDRAFLTYPDVCNVNFMGINVGNYFKFKPGFVESFNVNYSPQGNVLMKGGNPGVIDVSMSFLEARIHTRDDYK